MANIIVKVGQKSKLSFSNSKVYRAVIAEELSIYKEKFDFDLVIIERFQYDEYDIVKEFVENLISENKHVWFYIPDNDEVTGGLADELGIEPCMTERELFTSIYNKTGYNISVSFDIRNNLTNNEGDNDIEKDDFESLFGELSGEEQTEISETSEVGQIETSEVKQEDSETSEVSEVSEVEQTKTSEVEQKNIEEQLEQRIEQEEVVEKQSEKVVNLLKNNNNITKEEKQINLVKDTTNQKEFTKDTNKELVTKIDILQKSLTYSNNKVQEISKLNKALSDKYNTVVEEYNKLENSNILIEEPISLSEYKELEESLNKSTKEIDKFKNNIKELEEEIERLKSDNQGIAESTLSLKGDIEVKDTTIEELQLQLKGNENYIDSLQLQIKELKEQASNVDELNSKLASSIRKIDNLHEELEIKENRIELESMSRVEVLNISNILTNQIEELNLELSELKTKRREDEELIKSLESSGDNRANIMKQQTDELIDLRIKLEEASEDKENALRAERVIQDRLKTKIKELTEESKSKDMEIEILNKKYSHVSLAAEMSGNNTDALVEQNKELKSANSMLREQIRLMQNEVKNTTKDRTELVSSIENLKSKNKQLTVALSSLSSNVLGDTRDKASELTPITFSGKGQVLTVFGSGSYGISTTAYSIAKRLSRNSKVVIVDFDLVSPKIDTYIKINPINMDVPGYNQSEASKYSGLSIFLNKGIDYFLNNVQYIIKSAKEQTKFGRLDYISGCYYKPSAVDIIKADYSSLLTFLTSNYAYVILDFGRLGCSELNDKLIKVFSDAVFKNIVVTTAEKFEARNFRIKLEEAQINIKNVAWLLNMTRENRLPKDILNYISPALYSLMPFDYDFYCSKLPFTEASKSCRDKLEQFISSSIF